jgi:simple sugar transport system permease protein
MLCGILAGVVVGCIQGVVVLVLEGDQIVSAVGLNLLALGLTSFLLDSVYGGVDIKSPGFNSVAIPGLNKIPLIGGALFNQPVPVYLALVLVPVASIVMFRTYWGLRIRACGDGPRAADAAGVNVARTRFEAMLLASAAAGGAGALLALSQLDFFSEDITQGAGYIGLAAVLLGGWRPGRVALGALLFGTMAALNFTAQATGIGITPDVLVTLPYVAPLLVLATPIRSMKTPLYLGVPYRRGTRT